MNLPKQSTPVERTLAPAAILGQSGVEASAWYDPLINLAKTDLPIATGFGQSLGGFGQSPGGFGQSPGGFGQSPGGFGSL